MATKDDKVIYLKDRSPAAQSKRKKNIIKWSGIIAIGLIVFLWVIWPTGYKVKINGKEVGVISSRELIEESLTTVIAQLEQNYNTTIKLNNEDDIQVSYAKILPNNKITTSYLVTYMRNHMEFILEAKEMFVDGESIGYITSEDTLNDLLLRLTRQVYKTETINTRFINDIVLETTYITEQEILSDDALFDIATQTTKEAIIYEVQAGDTLSGIALKLGVSLLQLINANEGVTETSSISVGKKLNAHVDIPYIKIEVID